ncbi:MAG: N-acetylneuraminate synthase family protein [Oligoflexales bacterium]
MEETKIIAEIGCNHKGDMEIARELIQVAALYCKVDYVKFQKRCNKTLLTPDEYITPHPNPGNSYGDTYGEHREFLEFNTEQHQQLKTWCAEFGIGYSCSVWDINSTKDIISLNPDFIKVPSATNLNFPVLAYLAEHYSGDIHISLGMTSRKEQDEIVNFMKERNASKRVVLYSCTSGYPVPFEDICLLEIKDLQERFSDKVKAIGFSGHHLGISADVAALALGAEWIERHYTLDRTWKGTDHAASLEPTGMMKLGRDVRHVSQALSRKNTEVLPIEEVQRNKLKKRIEINA